MAPLRWIAKSGFRLTMALALLVFVVHATGELRRVHGGPASFLQRIELTALDAKFSARGENPPERWSVAIAAADEKSIKELGRLPWSRTVHAKLTDVLTDMGASAIAFDMIFSDEAGADPDRAFADAIARSGRVVQGILLYSRLEAQTFGEADLAAALRRVSSSTISELLSVGDDGLTYILPNASEAIEQGLYLHYFGVDAPVRVLAEAGEHFGTINADPDADGVNRRMPLVSTIKGTGVLLPTLALKAVSVATGLPIEVVQGPDAPEAVKLGERTIETELRAATVLDWYGEFNAERVPIFAIADLIAGRVPKEEIEGRVVFVAATAIGTFDQRVTPLSTTVPGIAIHATLAQNIIEGRQMSRPAWVVFFELLVFLAIGLLAGLVMVRLSAFLQVMTALFAAIVWLGLDRFVFFAQGLVVYTVTPVGQIFLSLLTVVTWRFFVEEKEKRKIRNAFGRYLAPAVMEQVLANPEEYLKLGGKRYEATVLFSDIRGFTTISEALSPEDLGTLLNRYMTPMTNIVFAHGGTLDKYIGDAVMAFWGAPVPQPDHAVRACRAALEMIEKVKDLNVEFEKARLPRIAIGIGLSSGPMTIGNMGSDDHLAYTALGDRVNLGSRLEGQTKEYGVDIIISDACYQLVKDAMACRELGALRVKGKLEPVRIYQLVSEGKLSGDKEAFVAAFHEGLQLFRGRDFDGAIAVFTRALDLAGPAGDRSTEDYLEMCAEYKESPPPANWDGVRIATSK